MNLKKMYLESLENAFELAKVAKTKDDVALAKADVYAKVALAIASGLVDVSEEAAPQTTVQNTAPEPKQESEPEPAKAAAKVIDLAKDVMIPLPPDRYEEEDPEARKARYTYLKNKYQDMLLKDLPDEAWDYLKPEVNATRLFEWLWDEAFHDNSAARKESIIRDYTENKTSAMEEVPLALFLDKIIPCELEWNGFMMYEDTDKVNQILTRCTSNHYKDFRTLTNFAVGVWLTAVKKYMENNFDIEKVS